jgi:hypothetical protein
MIERVRIERERIETWGERESEKERALTGVRRERRASVQH